jgi:hypothetical protein
LAATQDSDFHSCEDSIHNGAADLEEQAIWLFLFHMLPDYAHKHFTDKRGCYCLLMEALAMDKLA